LLQSYCLPSHIQSLRGLLWSSPCLMIAHLLTAWKVKMFPE